jgi:hypothetical protein
VRFSLIFGPYGARFKPFSARLGAFATEKLFFQTEAKVMHFVTLMVPPAHTDHHLMDNSTRGMSSGQKGLQLRFRENVRFRPFSCVIAHDFQYSGQIFLQRPGCGQTPCRRHLVRFSLIFGPYGACFRAFSARLGGFATEKIFFQTEAKMMHFVTLMVPTPRTDHH